MVHKDTYDVIATISEKHADASPNPSAAYLKAMIDLSEIIGDTAWKVSDISEQWREGDH